MRDKVKIEDFASKTYDKLLVKERSNHRKKIAENYELLNSLQSICNAMGKRIAILSLQNEIILSVSDFGRGDKNRKNIGLDY